MIGLLRLVHPCLKTEDEMVRAVEVSGAPKLYQLIISPVEKYGFKTSHEHTPSASTLSTVRLS